jgi:hypothetical protein
MRFMQHKTLVQLDTQTRKLVSGKQSVMLQQARGARFLALLIEAHQHNQTVSRAQVQNLWNFAQPPDRTAIKRLVEGVEKAIDKLLGISLGGHLQYETRQKTTGPWRLRKATNELWECLPVAGVEPQQSSSPVALKQHHVRIARSDSGVLAVVGALLTADGLSMQDAKHAEAYRALSTSIRSKDLVSELTMEGAALLWLRVAGYARLAGNIKNARQALKFAFNSCQKCELGLAKENLLQSCHLVSARIDYTSNWQALREDGYMAKLYDLTAGGASAHRLWEFANLTSLSERRRIQDTGERLEKMQASLNGMAWFNTGLFWILLDAHWLHIQAACLNHCYFLYALEIVQFETTPKATIDWLSLACKITARFSHQDDCPQDYFFIAQIWLEADALRRGQIAADNAINVSGAHPKTPYFWDNMVNICAQYGTADNQKHAKHLMLMRNKQTIRQSGAFTR